MSKNKVIAKQQNKINLKDFGTQRTVDIDYEEFSKFMDCISVRKAGESLSEEELMKPYIGSQGEYIWDQDSILPIYLQDLCNIAKAVFSLKKEIKGYSLKIFPPAGNIDAANITSISRVPQEAAMTIGARIIIPLGTAEELNIFVSTGQGMSQSASGSIRLADKTGLMTPIGLAAGADFSFNDSRFGSVEPRPGFRKMTYKKTPTNRYMIVIDCINDMSVLLQAVKDEAKAKSNGDEAKAAEIEQTIKEAMGLPQSHPIDEVAAAASSS